MSRTSDLSRAAKGYVNDLTEQAKSTAAQKAAAQADTAKFEAAQKAQAAANAAEAAAGEFDPASPQAQAMQQVADHIEDVAARLRSADLRQLAQQTTEVARQNPLLFIGGAALLGFAAARFLKARDPMPENASFEADPWAEPAASRNATAGGGRTHG